MEEILDELKTNLSIDIWLIGKSFDRNYLTVSIKYKDEIICQDEISVDKILEP